MTLCLLDIEQFRCIRKAHLELAPQWNVIVGENAAGKTSVLEAIFLLGAGHSFRTPVSETLIHHDCDDFMVVGKISDPMGQCVIGAKGKHGSREFRVNGAPAPSMAELAKRFPVQVIDPEVHRLLEDGPLRRRRYLDWGVFHVEQQFHEAWKRYNRALRQRNAALRRADQTNGYRIWEAELSEQGSKVAELRDQYVEDLQPFVCELGHRLLGMEVTLEHQRGWRGQQSLTDALLAARDRDCLRGMTSVGPHRADLVLKINGRLAKEQVSRGQQKMLACVLILAQQLHRKSIHAPPACLLLDDPAAELDVDNLGKLLAVVADLSVQLVVTTLTPDISKLLPHAHLFHVEHGTVKAVA